MKTAAYLRVSSKSQDHATQRAAIERAASTRGDTVSAWYAEKQSGKSMARAELQRLRVDARAGHLRRLYVFRLDRLTRSGIRDTFELIEELRAHGVDIVSVADGFDLHGPASEVVLAVMAWAAKMERIAINERIAAARERVEAAGGRWGRPRRMARDDVARAAAMQAQGRSVREIAVALKVPRSTVGRALASQNGGLVEQRSCPSDLPPEPPPVR
ncbi:MAG: recombinase family protein [Myxococcales bacterium]|nr:recombinase family protein [Myxococcales bacterium]